jgi:acyl-CoA thioester hydrolase
LASQYTLKRRVQFYETDMAGLVHFSSFFRYMEEAEHALWRESGLSIAPPGAEIGFPRIAASFEYHRPLRFEDEFEVHIRIIAITERTMQYQCVISREDKRMATGSLTIACVSKRPSEPLGSRSIPPEVAERFEVAPARDGIS